MHILIISDAYPPMRTSCATQIYDLAQAFIEQSHQVSIIIPAYSQKKSVEISNADGPTVYAVRCFKTKDVGYARRTLAEFVNPFIIGFHLKRNSNFTGQKIDGIAWYSPTIFWGPLVKQLKGEFKCKAYLILRDIFPDWALDLGLLKKNLIYIFFKRVQKYQYDVADVIGAQSPNSMRYLSQNYAKSFSKIEVLWNWVGKLRLQPCSIDISQSKLKGKKVAVYAGNMGIAQGVDQLLELVQAAKDCNQFGFIFIGRGSERVRLEEACKAKAIENVMFYDEIDQGEIFALFTQCAMGLVVLDPRHKTQNIPGKFLAYLKAELPIFAILNPGNDLIELINKNRLGLALANDSASIKLISREFLGFIEDLESERKAHFQKNDEILRVFDPILATKQILSSFESVEIRSI